MNVGFSNLATLKTCLLAKALQASADYDTPIKLIGLGVAAAFGNFCNRKFTRTANDTEILPADRVRFLLSRFPLESVSLLELKISESQGFQQLDAPPWNVLQTIDLAAGILIFPNGNDVGPDYAQLRVTYTGGYFWEQLEPTDGGYPTAQPNGSTALPSDLLEAWLLQCEITWKMRDKLGKQITQDGEGKGRGPMYEINDLDLAPVVKQMLSQFVRYNLV